MATCVNQQENSDYSAETGFYPQVNDDANLEQLFLFTGLKCIHKLLLPVDDVKHI